MTQRLIKHGTAAGYNAEVKTGNVCVRCRNARRVYQAQFTKKAKEARGGRSPQYDTHTVIDHLYGAQPRATAPQRDEPRTAVGRPSPEPTPAPQRSDSEPHTQPDEPVGPSLADRLKSAMGRMGGESYVQTEGMPDYLRVNDDVKPDPEPEGGDWPKVDTGETYVMTEQSLSIIEGNLATYLSVVGITVEMIDPYCGPILADNFDNMIHRWTRVIGRYPAAAKHFMSESGGTIMAWISAIQATWPVLYALYEHHFAKTVVTEKGRVMRVSKTNPDQRFDATMPPQPGFDYTVN